VWPGVPVGNLIFLCCGSEMQLQMGVFLLGARRVTVVCALRLTAADLQRRCPALVVLSIRAWRLLTLCYY
jgi:hypothetical protein